MPIQGSWDEVMAQKRAAGKKIIARSPPNRRFPGEDIFRDCAATMTISEMSAKFKVSESTVINWLKRCKIKVDRRKKKSLLKLNPNSPLMERWARVKLSPAKGINGWFRKLPF